MTTGIIIGIVGIILSGIIGILSILFYKRSRNKIGLQFQNRECYSLFREDVNRLNIVLSYDNKPLTNTLILLKAKLINNGQIDIDNNRIYSPLKIHTSSEYKFLECTITSQPAGGDVNIQLNSERDIQIDWDLLKKEEFIEIEILAEIVGKSKIDGEKALDFYNNIDFNFRITDLNSIQKEKELSSRNRFKKTILSAVKIYIIIVFVGSLIFLVLYFNPKLGSKIGATTIEYRISDGESSKVTRLKVNRNKVTVRFMETDEIIEISTEEFNKLYKIQNIERLTNNLEELKKFYGIAGIIFFSLGLLMSLIYYRTLKPIKYDPLSFFFK